MVADAAIEHAEQWLVTQLAGKPLPPLVVAIGMGDGYLLDALERRGATSRVLAFEPDPDAARRFLSRRDWTPWLSSGRLAHLVDPDYAGADQAWRVFPSNPDDHLLLVDPSLAQRGGEGAVRAARIFKRVLFGARANAEARRQFAPRYLVNALHNAAAIACGADVRSLDGAYRSVPVVIAAAGPSLDDALPVLAERREGVLLIAVDTALRPLLDYGIEPHFVVGLDPSQQNGRHFKALPACPNTWLISETALDPLAATVFEDRVCWFRVADHHPWPWLRGLGVDAGHIDVWGSVLTAAFQVALPAGCDPVVIVGADLAYTGGRSYARGTTYEYSWGYSAALGDALARAWRMQAAAHEALQVPDLHGQLTHSTPPLQAFRDWMVTQAARCGRRVVNATGNGILFGAGIEQSSLRDALDGALTPRKLPEVRSVMRPLADAARRAELAKAIRELVPRLGARSHAQVEQWRAFAGDGYDAVAVGAALEAALAKLDTRGATPGASPDARRQPRREQAPTQSVAPRAHVSAWAAPLGSPSAPGSVLRELPEGIARLRLALSSETLSGSELSEARDARAVARAARDLARALDELGPACEALEAFVEDAAAPLVRQALGPAPVSGMCAWPDQLSWPIQRIEALLGLAWPVDHSTRTVALDHVGTVAPADVVEPATPVVPCFYSRPVLPREPAPDQEPSVSEKPGAISPAGAAVRQVSPPRVADVARARLVLEWLRCASLQTWSGAEHDAPVQGDLATRWRLARVLAAVESLECTPSQPHAERAPQSTPPNTGASHPANETGVRGRDKANAVLAPSGEAGVTVVVSSDVADLMRQCASPSVRQGLPRAPMLPLDERRLARVLTGVLRDAGAVQGESARVLTPIVLTDCGVPGMSIAYEHRGGVVCVAPHQRHSTWVNSARVPTVHREWPRPIIGELPMGESGAVAWNHQPDGDGGYVMYCLERESTVITDEVPFRPTMGTWWEGRIYFSCFPSGIGVWSPGKSSQALESGTFRSVLAEGDGLVLEPIERGQYNAPLRRRFPHAWRWVPGAAPQRVASGALGAMGCRSTGNGWTAVGHPQADVIALTSRDGRTVRLTCYYPLTLAWVGKSLLVGTIGLELLCFEQLADALDSL